jgi:hypothetical protein
MFRSNGRNLRPIKICRDTVPVHPTRAVGQRAKSALTITSKLEIIKPCMKAICRRPSAIGNPVTNKAVRRLLSLGNHIQYNMHAVLILGTHNTHTQLCDIRSQAQNRS